MIFNNIPKTTGDEADIELRNPQTTAKRVQELFDEWWPRRKESIAYNGKCYLLTVWCMRIGLASIIESFLPPLATLHFPKAKLTVEQIALLEQAIEKQKENGSEKC